MITRVARSRFGASGSWRESLGATLLRGQVTRLSRENTGTAEYFTSRNRCQQQLYQGQKIYVLGTVPLSYSSAAHVTNALQHLRPGAILLDVDRDTIGPSKYHPHCKSVISQRVNKLLLDKELMVTPEKVLLNESDGLSQVDWLMTIGYLVTQLPDCHLMSIRQPPSQLTTTTLSSIHHDFLASAFEQTKTLLQLESQAIFCFPSALSQIFEHAAKRLFSNTIYKSSVYDMANQLRRAASYKPVLITQEDMLERITQVFQARSQRDDRPIEGIDGVGLEQRARGVALCSLFFGFSLESNRDWINSISDHKKVQSHYFQLIQSLSQLYQQPSTPKRLPFLSPSETISNIKLRYNQSQHYNLLSINRMVQLDDNLNKLLAKVMQELEQHGLHGTLEEVKQYLRGEYGYRNVETFSKLIGKAAIQHRMEVRLPPHHFQKFLPYYSATLLSTFYQQRQQYQLQQVQTKRRTPELLGNDLPAKELVARGYEVLGYFQDNGSVRKFVSPGQEGFSMEKALQGFDDDGKQN